MTILQIQKNNQQIDLKKKKTTLDILSVAKLLLSFKSVTYKKLQQLLFLLQYQSFTKNGGAFFIEGFSFTHYQKLQYPLSMEIRKHFQKFGRKCIPPEPIDKENFSPEDLIFVKKFMDDFGCKSATFCRGRINFIFLNVVAG